MLTFSTWNTPTAEHLASVVKSPDLVTALEPLAGGSLRAKTQTWASYCQPIQWLGDQGITAAVEELSKARSRYLDSGFDLEEARTYCFRYFSLLDSVLESDACSSRPSHWERTLQMVLAFECFPIHDLSPARGGQCAGTTTVRNPVYLLAKLKAPDAGDDTKFLPLVTLDDKPPRLFFHYRQYRVVADPAFAVLGHLPNEAAFRQAGLRLAGNLGMALHSSPDPYVRPRANRLWASVLLPLLEDTVKRSPNGMPLDVVDIGAGSGRLAANLCVRYVRWSLQGALEPILRLWFVERSGHDPSALFRAKSVSRYVRNVTVLPSDYRTWLAKSPMIPAPSGLRLGIVSKVFDLASSFIISDVSSGELESAGGCQANGPDAPYLPTNCLAPAGTGPEALIVPNSRTSVGAGHLYPQLSLHPYHRGLSILAGFPASTSECARLSLPIRVFDPDSLRAEDGSSILERLCRHCSYVIVEDHDMRPTDLLRHLTGFSLKQLAALDLTQDMGLKENYSYLLWAKDRDAPPLEGERLW